MTRRAPWRPCGPPHTAQDAAIIGEVLDGPEDMVLLKTEAGGSRVLDMLVGDPLPRIC